MGMEFDYQRTLLSISLVCWSCCWWLYLDILYAAVFPPSHRLFLFSLSTFPPLLLVIAYVTGHVNYPIRPHQLLDADDYPSFLSWFKAQFWAEFKQFWAEFNVLVDLPVLALFYLVSGFFMASSPAIYAASSGFAFAVVYVGGCVFYLVSLQDADPPRYWMLVYVLGVLAYNTLVIGDDPRSEKRRIFVVLSAVIAVLCNFVLTLRGQQELLARYRAFEKRRIRLENMV